jgi:hypothetical protein
MAQTTSSSPAANALDYYGLWKLLDALCDAAFYGKHRQYALGNTLSNVSWASGAMACA